MVYELKQEAECHLVDLNWKYTRQAAPIFLPLCACTPLSMSLQVPQELIGGL